MLIAGFPSGSFQANCYLVAPGRGRSAVVVDPGEGSADRVAALAAEHELTVVGVLLTHGHLDHVADAATVCDRFDVPALVHPSDEHMLDDPLGALGPQFRAALAGSGWDRLRPRPRTVLELVPGTALEIADLVLHVDHTPGHTQGSVVLRVDAEGERPEVLFTGDTLFAGSIGRTDLPGGDHDQLLESIERELLVRPDSAVVLPGHGSTSTIGAERRANPFLSTLVR